LEVRIKGGLKQQVQAALDEAKKTIKDITGLEVSDITASFDSNTNTIKEYKVGVKIVWCGALNFLIFYFYNLYVTSGTYHSVMF
jgi:flavin-binding protein dodecin